MAPASGKTQTMPATAQELEDARQLGEIVACVKQLTSIVGDHEARLRRMEKYAFMAFGVFVVFHFVTEWLDKWQKVQQLIGPH